MSLNKKNKKSNKCSKQFHFLFITCIEGASHLPNDPKTQKNTIEKKRQTHFENTKNLLKKLKKRLKTTLKSYLK